MDGSKCRICLQASNKLQPIITKDKVSPSPYEKLRQLKLIEITVTDLSCICNPCLDELDNCVKFLQKCEHSNKILDSKNHTQSKCVNSQISYLDGHLDSKLPDKNVNSNITRDSEEFSDLEATGQEHLVCGPCRKCDLKCNCARKPSVHTCDICQKVFTKKFNYQIHVKRHLGIRDWPCLTCGAPQVSSWLAKRHCKSLPRFCCPAPNCTRSYTSGHNLTVHIRSHTGDKPYKCSHCRKGFTSKTTLNDHVRTHTGVKPYMCAICGARFATNKLVAHLRTHAHKPRDRPRDTSTDATRSRVGMYACLHCSMRYSHKQSLNRHLRKRHTNNLQEQSGSGIQNVLNINSECVS